MPNSVLVKVIAETASGASLKVEGIELMNSSWSSRDDWEDYTDSLTGETLIVAQALGRFHGIKRFEIRDNLILIKSDCDRSRIEQTVAAALGAELVEYVPPPRLRIRDLIARH